MATPNQFYDSFVAGDTYTLETVYGAGEVDLTGWTIRFQMRASYFADEAVIEIDEEMDYDEAVNGIARITIPDIDTEDLVPEGRKEKKYLFDMELRNPEDDFVTTILIGELTACLGFTR